MDKIRMTISTIYIVMLIAQMIYNFMKESNGKEKRSKLRLLKLEQMFLNYEINGQFKLNKDLEK